MGLIQGKKTKNQKGQNHTSQKDDVISLLCIFEDVSALTLINNIKQIKTSKEMQVKTL